MLGDHLATEFVLSFLSHYNLGIVALASQALCAAVTDAALWRHLYQRRWTKVPGWEGARAEYRKRHLAEHTTGFRDIVRRSDIYSFTLQLESRPSTNQSQGAASSNSGVDFVTFFSGSESTRVRSNRKWFGVDITNTIKNPTAVVSEPCCGLCETRGTLSVMRMSDKAVACVWRWREGTCVALIHHSLESHSRRHFCRK